MESVPSVQASLDTDESEMIAPPKSPSSLANELSRRLTFFDQEPSTNLSLTPAYVTEQSANLLFSEARHGALGDDGETEEAVLGEGLVSKWRQKERLKTTAVALVVCLNIGVDPPDIIKISPCARLECWVDPLSMQAPKALDTIGKNLQAQYERWQPRAKYKMHLDPTTEDVKKLAVSCRRTAKNERVLFHYNGHGVPRPTANGEIWVFNKSYTQYIPLSVYDLQTWVGTPAIYIFDCSVAGQILFSFKQFMLQRHHEQEGYPAGFAPGSESGPPSSIAASNAAAATAMKDCILLCACSENELLPQNPDLPADVFTSCLTTPIKVALRWFSSRSVLRHEGVTKELIDRIPGKQTDRKTPLGELNWIFTAITDTIAWNVLPRALFQKLFRQDLLVASLFRNFLLAERIMRAANCTPVSYPRLPPMHQHPMWQAWDMAAEMCLLQLPDLLQSDGTKEYQPSPFFSEQLTAFELWLEHGSAEKRPPEQLPIVLQVLLSQVHRLRALVLLGRFLDMGCWAVDLALSVGIFPYVLKLLQTTALDLRQTLVFIWAKILAWDANSQVQSDLIKDGGHLYFIKHLESQDASVGPDSRAQAAFVLSAICKGHPKGQLVCAQSGLLQVCANQLPATLAAMSAVEHTDPAGARSMGQLVKWLILCIGQLCEDMPEVAAMALREQASAYLVHEMLLKLLALDDPEIRGAVVFALGTLIQASESIEVPPSDSEGLGALLPEQDRLVLERAIICGLLEVVYDASPLVRCEVARALARVALGHSLLFQDAVHAHQRTSAHISRVSPGAQSRGSHPDASRSAPEKSTAGSSEQAWASSNSVQEASSSVGKASSSHGSALQENSPGVRLRDDLSYEPVLHVGLDEANLGGVYASADAARVGGGLYHAVVEALCTLATDPTPQVVRTGQQALRSAHVELVNYCPQRQSYSLPASPSRPTQTPIGMPQQPVHGHGGGSASGMSSFLPKSWQAKSWRSFSQPTTARPPSASVASSEPPSPAGSISSTQFGLVGDSASRAPFMLRRLPEDAAIDGTVRHGAAFTAESRNRTGPSQVYTLSCRQYRWPLLAPLSLEEPGPAWLKPCPTAKVQDRREMRDAGIARCMAVASHTVRLREPVRTVNVGAEMTSAVLLDNFKYHMVATDGEGVVRIVDYGPNEPKLLNQFPAVPDAFSPVRSLYRLNEFYNEVLMACTSDGVVSIWRNYASKGRQQLATAWQSVLVPCTGAPSAEATFAYSSEYLGGVLFAAGGRETQKGCLINAWDLHRESCVSQLGSPGPDSGAPLVFRSLAASKQSPILYAADSSGYIHIYDCRSSEKVGGAQPSKERIIGLVAEPGGDENKLIVGYRSGSISFMDCRMVGGSPTTSLLRNVEGHSKGNMTTICGHSCAPLLATATATQVVKLWSMEGKQLGVVRAHSSILGQPIGPTTCLAFAPYSLHLASGGKDSICAVYSVDFDSQS